MSADLKAKPKKIQLEYDPSDSVVPPNYIDMAIRQILIDAWQNNEPLKIFDKFIFEEYRDRNITSDLDIKQSLIYSLLRKNKFIE